MSGDEAEVDEDVLQREEAYREASESPASMKAMFEAMRPLAKGHLQQFPESFAPLEAFRHFYDTILPSLFNNLTVWYRSRRHNIVGIVKFNGTRLVKPSDLRSVQLSNLSSLAESLTFVQRARLLRWSVCMVAMVNLCVTTVKCNTGTTPAKAAEEQAVFDTFLDTIQSQAQARRAAALAAAKAAGVTDEEEVAKAVEAAAADAGESPWDNMEDGEFSMGELTPAQEEQLRKASCVRHNFSQEVPLFKCPFPLGDEDPDDPQRVSTLDRKAGSFIISGKAPQKMHALRRSLPNVPHTAVVKDGSKRYLRVTGYMRRDDAFINTYTFHMRTLWDHAAFPTIQVIVAYPRNQALSLYQFFLLLMVDDVATILKLMWPCGVPSREVGVHQTIREMLVRQRDASVRNKITTREQLFSRMHFEGLEDYTKDDIRGLHHYDWVKESTVNRICPQQGRVPVRTVMLAKALNVAYFAYVTAVTAAGQRPLTDRDAPRMHTEELLDQLLGQETKRALVKHVQPMLRRLMRDCASTGSEVSGAVLHNKHRQMTGCIFANVFAGRGGGRSSAIGADLRLQSARFSATDVANTAVHMTITNKGATVAVRALRQSAYMHYGAHSPDGPSLQLTTHRVAASHFWQRGIVRVQLERFVRALFGSDLTDAIPPKTVADEAYTATTRAVDFWVTPVWQRAAARHVVSRFADSVLVLVNHAIIGFVRGSQTEVMARVLAGRTLGVLPRVVEVLPHRLGVDICCENGTLRRPVIVLSRWVMLRTLIRSYFGGADYTTLTPPQLLRAAWRLGVVEYLSSREIYERRMVIADSPYRLKAEGAAREFVGSPFTHMDLHPQLAFGILGQVPFTGCVSSPRLVFTAKMMSQAVFRSEDPRDAQDQGVCLTNGEVPVIQTLVSEARGASRMGQNVVIAFLAWDCVQDDSLVVQKEFAEAGGFSVRRRQVYTVINGTRWRIVGRSTWVNFNNIELVRRGDRSKLDPSGVIRVGSEVVPHETVLIQRVCCKTVGNKTEQRQVLEDASLMHTRSSHEDERWTVTEVNYLSRGFVQVVLERDQQLEVGDKLTDLYGQKATVGRLIPRAELPQFASGPMKGQSPTVIAHPACLTRMTVGSLLAMITGVSAAFNAEVVDATYGEPFDLETHRRACQAAGLDRHARALMRDPASGLLLQETRLQPDGRLKYIPHRISVGFVTMLRIYKHTPSQVTAACGAKVAQSATTGQPLRSARRHHHQGAPIRFGVMPQHAAFMHGAAFVLKDAVRRGGVTTERVCADCHLLVPSPPYDLVNMVRSSLVRAAVAMRALLKACTTCPHCGSSRVVRAESTAMLRLVSFILHGANTRLEFYVEPTSNDRVQVLASKARVRAQRLMLAQLDEAQRRVAKQSAMLIIEDEKAGSGTDEGVEVEAEAEEDERPLKADDDYLTFNVLTMYEQANVVGMRAEQLEFNAAPLIDLKEIPAHFGVCNAIVIAREELRRGLLPFRIRRFFPDGTFEERSIQGMRLAHL